jgi:hypothetical protein
MNNNYKDWSVATWLVYLTEGEDPLVYDGRYDAVLKEIKTLPGYSDKTVVKKAQYKNLGRREIDIHEIWMAKHEICPNGVLGIEWASDIGFGRYELILGDDGKLHAMTEHMDFPEHKDFTRDVLTALMKHIEIDD